MNLSIEVASMLLEACVIALGVVFVGDTLLASSRSLQKVDPSSTANKPKPKSFQWDLLKLGNKLAVLGFVYASAMMFKKGVNGHVDTIYFGLSMACLAYFFTFFGVAIIRQFISDADNTASPTNTDTTPAPKSEPAGKWGNLKLQIVRDMLCLVGRVTSDAETPYKHVLWRLTRSVKQNAVWCTHAEGSSAGIVRAVANISVCSCTAHIFSYYFFMYVCMYACMYVYKLVFTQLGNSYLSFVNSGADRDGSEYFNR